MNTLFVQLAPLLFASGFCSLAYQIVWIRQFRLIFGSSTMATSAVIAIFMGGIGFGSIYLGKIAQRHQKPLHLYGYFELVIACSAIVTPVSIFLIELIYLKTGGSQALGVFPATLLRLLLAILVIGVPAFFMGGTLPAITKTVINEMDLGRRDLGYLLGINTLGAVFGVGIVSFILLEDFGTRNSLWLSGALNLLVAAAAFAIATYSKSFAGLEATVYSRVNETTPFIADTQQTKPIPTWLIYLFAVIVGFCFFQMEMVWYRMLTPLLGGTTYTMAIILAMVLFGLAIGGWMYGSIRYTVTSSLNNLALVSSLEAFFLAVPFALGDSVAILASLLRPIGTVGMAGYVVGWLTICMITILPAAVAAGYQFPLLIGLKGYGRLKIASDTGSVYGWNTLGAIIGSLIGGGLILPFLGALLTWQLTVIVLCLVAFSGIILSVRFERWERSLLVPGVICIIAVLFINTLGPTAVWRHTPIGVGRVDLALKSHNEIKEWMNTERRVIIWEEEGYESSIALRAYDGLSFIINGKSDGNVHLDMGTQIMAPLVGAILHENPQKALVIGLGTGCSSGWLGAVDGITQVDTIEIEPAMLEVARQCSTMNRNVLENEKVQIIFGDGREILMTSREKYDIIFSEPSNPYRIGVSSLFTREFYQAVSQRLNNKGYFAQWVQGYEVDSQTIKVIYATLASIFPVIETWETQDSDLLFLCSMQETDYSVPRLRKRVQKEPFRTALLNAWGTTDLEGFISHFVANSSLTKQIQAQEKKMGRTINDDDKMMVEYGFARTLAKRKSFTSMDVRVQSRRRKEDRPHLRGGVLDWDLVLTNDHMLYPMEKIEIPDYEVHSQLDRFHVDAFNFFIKGNKRGVLAAWQRYGQEPKYPLELAMVSEAWADEGSIKALPYIKKLREYWPLTAEAIEARFYWRSGQSDKAFATLERVFQSFKNNPWIHSVVIENTFMLAMEVAARNKTMAKRLYELSAEPFSIYKLEEKRARLLLAFSLNLAPEFCLDAFGQIEPHPIWEEELLEYRLKCYQKNNSPLFKKAEIDLENFRKYAPERFIVSN